MIYCLNNVCLKQYKYTKTITIIQVFQVLFLLKNQHKNLIINNLYINIFTFLKL